jgi:hypothetical protein
MATLTDELIAELTTAPMHRTRIVDALGIKRGIADILRRTSRRLSPPHVVERRNKGERYEVEYFLRPAGREKAGQIIEVERFPTEDAVSPAAGR